ncbi:MAG: hypothetical protein WBQ60_06520 [Asticcacaulis sp.]
MSNSANTNATQNPPSGGTPALDDNKDTVAVPRESGNPDQDVDPADTIKEKFD